MSNEDTVNEESLFVSELAQLKKENQQQQETILQLTKELDVLSYSISHDLRAPLRAVTGFTRILEDDYKDALDAEGRRLLNTVSVNAGRMNDFIDGFLVFSRINRKGIMVRQVDMNALLEAVVHEINKTLQVPVDIIAGTLHAVVADVALIRLVLTNLISNAVKFSSKNEMPIIEIASQQDADEVIFSVKDNGVGFDMRYADKLFGVFQRLHSADEFEGAGMGLAIVHRIISKHGGKTWIKSKPGDGTVAYFSIPL